MTVIKTSNVFGSALFLECPSGYAVANSDAVCQDDGAWSNDVVSATCDRINYPPTEILISTTKIPENTGPGTIGEHLLYSLSSCLIKLLIRINYSLF